MQFAAHAGQAEGRMQRTAKRKPWDVSNVQSRVQPRRTFLKTAIMPQAGMADAAELPEAAAASQEKTQQQEAGILPPGWKSALDPASGNTYYYNVHTRRTTWQKPVQGMFIPTASGDAPQETAESPRKVYDRKTGRQYRSIYDKLCDHKLYTGTHKHRFDNNGLGRGLAGRDRLKKGHGTLTTGRHTSSGLYKGSTNTGTDEHFTSIAEFLTRY